MFGNALILFPVLGKHRLDINIVQIVQLVAEISIRSFSGTHGGHFNPKLDHLPPLGQPYVIENALDRFIRPKKHRIDVNIVQIGPIIAEISTRPFQRSGSLIAESGHLKRCRY